MGIDYFLINKTRKEYVWTARLNLVYDWDLFQKPLTEEMLENGFALNLLDDIQWVNTDYITDLLSIKIYHRYRKLYKTIKNYIKDCECYIIPDTEKVPEYAVNNIFIENEIFNEAGFISDLCEMMR